MTSSIERLSRARTPEEIQAALADLLDTPTRKPDEPHAHRSETFHLAPEKEKRLMQYRYVGQNPRYLGRTALGTHHDRRTGWLLLQFDEPARDESGLPLHLGWHAFPAADWERVA